MGKRDPMARALSSGLYRHQVVESKKTYDRKEEGRVLARLRQAAKSLIRDPAKGVDQTWRYVDQVQALSQGWGIFELHSDDEPEYQLQRHDGRGFFPDDANAWIWVHRMAEQGDSLCAKALNYLQERSPEEYERIIRYTMRSAA